MVKLSVNINKIATLRNARGGNIPNLLQVAKDIQIFGGQGITVHPRPDERHITYKDVYDLSKVVKKEFNIEGYPNERFMKLVLDIKPDQVTLVPDSDHAITSNRGWDTILHQNLLTDKVNQLKRKGIRSSIFLDPIPEMVPYVKKIGADGIELYTGYYSFGFMKKKFDCIHSYINTAKIANSNKLFVNAGHDLNLENLSFLIENIPFLMEISIGHALISESLYLGLENTIQSYLKRIKKIYK
ncbi:pyridoxine 5'-phosphate synthase [Blattabacterium cuenoti]|uniref:pyridoxine 5'-phosphate synthase n=1 Tax=Blattabacterium cuenoti TaxID=1653831 RepID=UPI00163BC5AD|nr:pyridoxine 5'-phosphate synthase [Blattabacterium cuenoti]